jgi:hypothetical protein
MRILQKIRHFPLNLRRELPMKNQASRKGSGAGLDCGSVCWIGTRLQEASGLKKA